MINTNQIYWTAGFLEGEGYFGSVGGTRTTPTLFAGQVQKEPLDRLHSMFGGRMTLRTPKPRPDRGVQQPIWNWRVNSSMSVQLMMTLYSLMSPEKQEQIRWIISKWKKSRKRLLDTDNIKALYEEGNLCIREIAEKIGVSRTQAYMMLRKAGVDFRFKRVNPKPVDLNCSCFHCDKAFHLSTVKIARGKGKFCSVSCLRTYREKKKAA